MINLKKANNNNSTVLNNLKSVPYISFKSLDETGLVINGFSTRVGGVSNGIFKSMNLGYGRGDSDENVTENHKIIANAMGFDYRRIVTTNQTHTTNIRIVSENDAGKGIICLRDYHDIDGLITNVPNLPLATYYADCVPLYILDPVNNVIGLSHSGWKGTVNRIGFKTIELMHKTYGSEAKNLIVCIGPSICQDCYEVGEDVAARFKENFSKDCIDNILIYKGNEKYLLNLWEACREIFIEAGVDNSNISITDICTCCNKEYLFSHRGLNGKRGNLAAFLMLK